jgi:hypothetical protein
MRKPECTSEVHEDFRMRSNAVIVNFQPPHKLALAILGVFDIIRNSRSYMNKNFKVLIFIFREVRINMEYSMIPRKITKSLLMAFSALCFLASTPLLAVITVDELIGQLPRTTENLGQINFQLQVQGVKVRQAGEVDRWLRLKLAIDGGSPLGYTNTPTEGQSTDFYIDRQGVDAGITEDGTGADGLTTSFIYDITIRPVSNAQFSTVIRERKLKFNIQIFDPTAAGEIPATFTFEVKKDLINIPAVPKTAPEGFSLQGTHRTLAITWANTEKIPYSNNKEYNSPSINAVVYEFPDQDAANLPARTFSPEEDEDPVADHSCRYTAPAAGSTTCQITCQRANVANTDTYLDFAAIKETPGYTKSFKIAAKRNSAEITGLENGQAYAVFLYYAEEGITFSSCLVATPQRNYSLTEYLGGEEAKEKQISCFIASAAYGTPHHKNLDSLRWFRDAILIQSKIGKTLVDWYYASSPPIADWISEREWAKASVRLVLTPIIGLIKLIEPQDKPEQELNTSKI